MDVVEVADGQVWDAALLTLSQPHILQNLGETGGDGCCGSKTRSPLRLHC